MDYREQYITETYKRMREVAATTDLKFFDVKTRIREFHTLTIDGGRQTGKTKAVVEFLKKHKAIEPSKPIYYITRYPYDILEALADANGVVDMASPERPVRASVSALSKLVVDNGAEIVAISGSQEWMQDSIALLAERIAKEKLSHTFSKNLLVILDN